MKENISPALIGVICYLAGMLTVLAITAFRSDKG